MHRQAVIALWIGVAAAGAPALGQITVTGSGCVALSGMPYAITNLGGDHYDVSLNSLYHPWGDSIYEVRPMWSGIAIDHLTIAIDGPPAGSPVTVRVLSKCSDGSTKFRTVSNILQTGNAEVLIARVDVTEDIGRIEAIDIGEINAGRDILGPIISTTPDNVARGISKLFATRSILADLSAPNGRIAWLSTVNGDFGSAAHPLQIQAKHGVVSVNCSVGDVYADIKTRINGGSGTISFVQARKFTGTIETGPALIPVSGPGGFPGEFRIHQQLNGKISMGTAFVPPSFMLLPLGGLTGQIVINADNIPTGVWTGGVTFHLNDVPQFTINGPSYSQTATLLGGGSIAAAPFGLHGTSCTPAVNGMLAIGGCGSGSSASVRLRFYGPIAWSGSAPVVISRRPAGSTGAFTSIPASNFTVSNVSGDLNSMQVAPVAGASIGFNPGFEYRIQPQPSLVCAGVIGSPAVQTFDYRVTTSSGGGGGGCTADFDCSGGVNGIDLSTLLAQWGPCGACAADLDHNGVVNGLDLSMLLGAWGPCGGAASGGGRRVNEAGAPRATGFSGGGRAGRLGRRRRP